MQPAPLTGTATAAAAAPALDFVDAARTPHGDSNLGGNRCAVQIDAVDAARTPHGDSNGFVNISVWIKGGCSPHPSRGQQQSFLRKVIVSRDAARTPHGDSNTAHCPIYKTIIRDAARTPHGDNNSATAARRAFWVAGCSPYPSRGQQL